MRKSALYGKETRAEATSRILFKFEEPRCVSATTNILEGNRLLELEHSINITAQYSNKPRLGEHVHILSLVWIQYRGGNDQARGLGCPTNFQFYRSALEDYR